MTELPSQSVRRATTFVAVSGRSAAAVTSVATGSVVCLLGIVVILGWFAGATTVVQVYPTFAPMQFNTALCFLLVGVGILFLHRAPLPIAMMCGVFAALIGFASLLQYIAGVDLGIDNLVVTPDVTTKTSHPGRMAPNTAFCFMMAGTAVTLLHRRGAGARTGFAGKCLAAITFSLAVVALVGYVARIEDAYGWADLTRMAVHTATGFTVAGVGIYFGHNRPAGMTAPPSLLSDAPILLGGVVLVVSMWQALSAFEAQEVAKAARSNVALFRTRVENRMNDRVLALKRMARRQSTRDHEEFDLWRRDARAYLRDFQSLREIGLLDGALKVRASGRGKVPPGAALTVLVDGGVETGTPNTRTDTVTRTFATNDGRRSLLVLVPKFRSGRHSGFVAAQFLVAGMLDRDVRQLRRLGVEISIHEGSVLIYGAPTAGDGGNVLARSRIRLGPLGWRVSAWPNASLMESHQSLLPEGVLFAGLLFLVLLASMLYYARQANARTAETEAALRRAHIESARLADARASIQVLNDELNETVDRLAARERDLEEAQSIGEIGSWVRDLKTNGIEWSDYLFQLYGRDPETFTPSYAGWLDQIHPDDRMAIADAMAGTLERDEPYEWEARITTPGGRREVVLNRGRLERAPDGTPMRMIGTAQRITQRKEMEEKLRQINVELEQFASVAAHDLQEPVRKIVSFSELLVKDLGDDLPENAGRDIEFIVSAARRMRELVQALLTLSRTGRSDLNLSPVPLRECVEDALDVLSGRIEESGATVDIGHLPEVHGDRTLLTQLYQNLIGNALKFVPADRVPHIAVGMREDQGIEVFTVRDNGIGIEPKYAEQIFRPFQRLHARDAFEGTGIGLAICQKAVERHGGDIWAERADGGGTAFCFTLDARRPARHGPDA